MLGPDTDRLWNFLKNESSLNVADGGFFVRATSKPRLTLDQKLKAFDPKSHGGEVMAGVLVGAERVTCSTFEAYFAKADAMLMPAARALTDEDVVRLVKASPSE